MNTAKLENLLELSLNATEREREKSGVLEVGYMPETRRWEIIVRYTGELGEIRERYPAVKITELLNGYAIMELTEQEIAALSMENRIEYIEKPKRLYFTVSQGKRASCITVLQAAGGVTSGAVATNGATAGGRVSGGVTAGMAWDGNLSGRGVLAAVIDSGIDYSHPDFRNSDGTTRIRYLWDQTLLTDNGGAGSVPEPYDFGMVYDSAVINEALAQENTAERLSICPSVDLSGHGTHVAGIFAGNGRASDGANRGIAYESELIVVKLGRSGTDSFPRTTELMQAADFCIRTAVALQMPVVINLSFGNSYGSHDGNSLLETYFDDVSSYGRSVFVIGTGNEGNGNGHTGGNFFYDLVTEERLTNETQVYRNREIEFSVGNYETSFGVQIWKSYWDVFDIIILHPSGQSVGPLPAVLGTQRFTIQNTEILVYYGKPTPYSLYQEIYLDFIPADTYVNQGIWSITLVPKRIIDGRYDLWFPVQEALNLNTGFLYPTPDTTLTIPSTTTKAVAVGAYDSYFNQPAEFSGRGYTRLGRFVKPDLVAPGVGIVSAAPGGGYTSKTGTSMAAPFVSGSAALLMQWGITEGNDPYLYGEKIRAYLISGARQLPGVRENPNPVTGWGRLCVRDSIP